MKALLLALSLVFAVGLPFTTVSAQQSDGATPEAGSVESGPEVEGILSIYDRTFSSGPSLPIASPETDVPASGTDDALRMLSIQAITFETDEKAEAYLAMMRDALDSDVPRAEGLGEFAVTELDEPGIDGFKMTTDMGDFDFGATIIIFVDGNLAFQIAVTESDQSSSEALADEVIDFILNAEVEDEDISFDMDGTSTGGVFDRMPTLDDDIVADFTGVSDTELFITAAE